MTIAQAGDEVPQLAFLIDDLDDDGQVVIQAERPARVGRLAEALNGPRDGGAGKAGLSHMAHDVFHQRAVADERSRRCRCGAGQLTLRLP